MPYEESIRVPLVVAGPGVPQGVTKSEIVANNDIAPTIAEVAHVAPNAPMDGRSLGPLLSKGPTPSDWRAAIMSENPGISGKPGHRMVRTERYAYIEWTTGEKELYDFTTDPYQLDNVYGSATQTLKEELSTRLNALKNCKKTECKTEEDKSIP